jgi:hypothetical protein
MGQVTDQCSEFVMGQVTDQCSEFVMVRKVSRF